ncbi:hypothetical protein DPEC_G00161520 [Dallia pectoralis]|uniref:Uncharacterized protein n=1 Tax=Dallia pectoralis TaxID=75939 RepID=A0ACC2GGF8_DALPE|nr:hypothetical protein DPEC_G00161520 [Dallia pectoralis]
MGLAGGSGLPLVYLTSHCFGCLHNEKTDRAIVPFSDPQKRERRGSLWAPGACTGPDLTQRSQDNERARVLTRGKPGDNGGLRRSSAGATPAVQQQH